MVISNHPDSADDVRGFGIPFFREDRVIQHHNHTIVFA
jgi:formyltetrahydrofolate hydrolase